MATNAYELYKQYQHEYQRIMQAIRRQEAKGFFVPEELKPVQPSKAGYISQSTVEQLRGISPEVIRQSSIRTDPDTGEVLDLPTNYEYTPQFAQVVIDNFMEELAPIMYHPGGRLVKNTVIEMIRDYGEERVAEMLNRAREEGLRPSHEQAYAEAAKAYIAELQEYLPDLGDMEREELAELAEELEQW